MTEKYAVASSFSLYLDENENLYLAFDDSPNLRIEYFTSERQAQDHALKISNTCGTSGIFTRDDKKWIFLYDSNDIQRRCS